jgi:hypothetical protein
MATSERRYKIHPAIGIARVGNAPADEYFIGPELPGRRDLVDSKVPPAPPFKAGKHQELVRPQAARFRIWEYTKQASGKWAASAELAASETVRIAWTVHLANRKASFWEFSGVRGDPGSTQPSSPAAQKRRQLRNAETTQNRADALEIDPGPRTIEGVNKSGREFTFSPTSDTGKKSARETWPTAKGAKVPLIDYLGELRTDDAGRLIVIGGKGRAVYTQGEPPKPRSNDTDLDFANNSKWFDDVSDGPITATITFTESGESFTALGSWVIVGPPDFAPYIQNVITLYDRLYDVAVCDLPVPKDETQYAPTGPLGRLARLATELTGSTEQRQKVLSRYQPSFREEIVPILDRSFAYRFVFDPSPDANDGPHGSKQKRRYHQMAVGPNARIDAQMRKRLATPRAGDDAKLRRYIVDRLRIPGSSWHNRREKSMPRLLGDLGNYYDNGDQTSERDRREFLTLTRTQFALLSRWAEDQERAFVVGNAPRADAITPQGLDRAALENAAGGGFCPGIEVGWQIRNPAIFVEPFRIKHDAPSGYAGEEKSLRIGPGYFTRQLAIPWHADFNMCRKEEDHAGYLVGWWPAQRPDDVYLSEQDVTALKMVDWTRPISGHWQPMDGDSQPTWPNNTEMTRYWNNFGFVLPAKSDGGVFLERERATQLTPAFPPKGASGGP